MGLGMRGCKGAPATGENSAKLLSRCGGTGEEYVGEGKSKGLKDPGLLAAVPTVPSCLGTFVKPPDPTDDS